MYKYFAFGAELNSKIPLNLDERINFPSLHKIDIKTHRREIQLTNDQLKETIIKTSHRTNSLLLKSIKDYTYFYRSSDLGLSVCASKRSATLLFSC